jgi:hypothetical protein
MKACGADHRLFLWFHPDGSIYPVIKHSHFTKSGNQEMDLEILQKVFESEDLRICLSVRQQKGNRHGKKRIQQTSKGLFSGFDEG